jgi:translation initiation factor IF-2
LRGGAKGVFRAIDRKLGLRAELLELKANPNLRARGVVIEGKLSSGQGPVATILVKNLPDGLLRELKRLKAERDGNRVRASLDRVQEAAEKGWNTVPPILEAVKAYATIGEICDRLRVVYGEYRES